ncbi:hypothetical protein Tco_0037439, partial [Tanacetum coccineum]
MLAQPTEDEGTVSERLSETQPTPSPTHPSEDQSESQPDLFLRPSSSNPILDSILEGSGGNHGGQSSSDRSQSGTEDDLTLQSVYDLCVSLCKQVTTQAANIKDLKAQIKQLKKKARPVINHYKAWIKSLSMKKRLARKKKMESVSKQGRKTFKSVLTVYKDPAFDDLDDAMDYMETEDAHDEGTLKDGNSDESAAPTTVFRDGETIAQFLVTMSQNKTKQKGIDPKDKGKKVFEEKTELDAKSEGVNKAEKKFKMLANDEEIAREVQEEWEAEEEKKKLAVEEATKAAFTNEYDF